MKPPTTVMIKSSTTPHYDAVKVMQYIQEYGQKIKVRGKKSETLPAKDRLVHPTSSHARPFPPCSLHPAPSILQQVAQLHFRIVPLNRSADLERPDHTTDLLKESGKTPDDSP